MAAHDASSPAVRFIGNYARATWSSLHLHNAVEAIARGHQVGRIEAAALLARHIDRQERRLTAETYGPDHPEAQP